MEVNYSPVGSAPLIPLQIAMGSVITYLDEDEPIAGTELGLSLISDFSATRFEYQTIVDDDNSNVAMVTFWIPRSVKSVSRVTILLRTKKEKDTIHHRALWKHTATNGCTWRTTET